MRHKLYILWDLAEFQRRDLNMFFFRSPYTWLLFRVLFKMGALDNVWQWTIRMFVRILQFTLCLLTIIFLSMGFVTGSFHGHSTMFGGGNVMWTTALSFLGLVYALWWIVLIEFLHLSPRPRVGYAVIMDSVLALCLVIAGIILLLSNFVSNCLSFGAFLKCSNLNAAVVFAFLSAASFLISPWLLWLWGHPKKPTTPVDEERQQPENPPTPSTYLQAKTPVPYTTEHPDHQV